MNKLGSMTNIILLTKLGLARLFFQAYASLGQDLVWQLTNTSAFFFSKKYSLETDFLYVLRAIIESSTKSVRHVKGQFIIQKVEKKVE